jgi:hypothetical protein
MPQVADPVTKVTCESAIIHATIKTDRRDNATGIDRLVASPNWHREQAPRTEITPVRMVGLDGVLCFPRLHAEASSNYAGYRERRTDGRRSISADLRTARHRLPALGVWYPLAPL